MAKQLVNPIERHVEKVVVAISAAALLGAAALFLITSPNKIDLGGTTVTPTTIDNEVAAHATEIRNRLRNHKPTSVVPEPLADDFVAATKQTPATVLAAAAPIRPTVPLIDPPITKVADFNLVEVLRPAKPVITTGRSTVNIGKPEEDRILRARDWGTVSAIFNRSTQSDLQKHAYGAANGRIQIGSPEIQRRAERPDGTWSEDDWISVAPEPAGDPLRLPKLQVVDGTSGPMIPREQVKQLERLIFELAGSEVQRERLRPQFYEIVNGTPWSFPIITNYADVLHQDDEVLFPDKPPAENPEDIYGLLDADDDAVPDEDLTDAQHVAANMRQAKAMLDRARKDQSKFDARSAYNLFFDIKRDPAASASIRSEAQKLEKDAEQLENQITRAGLIGRKNNAGVNNAGSEDEGPARKLLPAQQLWVNDGREGSIEGGRNYQYRIRFQIFNIFAGEAARFENPEDATKIFVASDWSPPSDPVSFEPWEAFFVTADDKTKNQVGFEFFRWYYGAWVKSRRQKFGVGDLVSVTQRTSVPSLQIAGETDNDDVEFSAAAAVLDVDFSRLHRERRKGSSAEGIRFAGTREETAVVLLDQEGRLTERIVRRDKDNPGKRALVDKSFKGKR